MKNLGHEGIVLPATPRTARPSVAAADRPIYPPVPRSVAGGTASRVPLELAEPRTSAPLPVDSGVENGFGNILAQWAGWIQHGSMTHVSASWSVPNSYVPFCASVATQKSTQKQFPECSSTTFQFDSWVGLAGAKRYGSSGDTCLVQAGMRSIVSLQGGKVFTNYPVFWWQWVTINESGAPETIVGSLSAVVIPPSPNCSQGLVNAGDLISITVDLKDSGPPPKVHLTYANLTLNTRFSVTIINPAILESYNPTSAEWIVEQNSTFPLARFGSIYFEHAVCINGGTVKTYAQNGTSNGAVAITNHTTVHDKMTRKSTKVTYTVAEAIGLGPNLFRVRYIDPHDPYEM
jgi:hypothetical protein